LATLTWQKDRHGNGLDMRDPFTDHHMSRRDIPLSEILSPKVRIPSSKLYKVTCWIFARRVAFRQRAFSILHVEFYRGSIVSRRQKLRSILKKPIDRIASKTSRRYQIDSGISVRNVNPSSPAPSDYRGPSLRSIGAANRWWSLGVFSRNLDSPTFPRLLIYSTSRDVYEWARYKFLDGRRCGCHVFRREGPSRVVLDRWDRRHAHTHTHAHTSHRNSQSEFPGYFTT